MNLLQLLINHQNELTLLVTVAIVMAISPGADFALVCRNTISSSRESGLYTTFGIASALWLHIAYCIAGLALVINNSPVLFMTIKYTGAIYLVFLGFQSFMMKTTTPHTQSPIKTLLSNRMAFVNGFTSNALNPKTTLLFLSIFTQLVSPSTPLTIQVIYGVIICIAHIIWFVSVSLLLSQQRFLNKIHRYEQQVNRLLGIVLVLFGLKVAYL